MLTRGLCKRDVQKLLVDNPRAVLTFAKPQLAALGLPGAPQLAALGLPGAPIALPGAKL